MPHGGFPHDLPQQDKGLNSFYWNACLEFLPGCFLRSKGYSIPISLATTPKLCLPCTRSMKMKRKRAIWPACIENRAWRLHLVLSTSGGMGRETQTSYKRLADMLSLKRHISYSSLMVWLRCKLSFTILRSTVMCIRGNRSSRHRAIHDSSDIYSPRLLRGLCASTILTPYPSNL